MRPSASSGALAAPAKANQTRLAYEAQVNGVNTGVARIRAALDDAEFNLEQATVRAPTDGFVTQVFLRPGMMTVPFPISPVMVFMHAGDPLFAAAFPQNALQRVGAGDDADLSGYHLPAGASAEVAVYTDRWRAFTLIRRILLRMRSWQNYVFL